MATGWAEITLAEQALPGIMARLVDSSYSPGGEASKRDQSVELRLRLSSGSPRIKAGRQGGVMHVAGKLLLIPSNTETHAISDEAQSIRSLSLKIDPSWIEDTLGVESFNLSGDDLLNFNFCNDHVHRAMYRISSEILNPTAYKEKVIDACCRFIAAELLCATSRQKSDMGEVRDLIVEKRIRAIENFIYEFGDGCPTLADVAQEFNLGVGYVRQFYKSATERTLFDFIQEVRVARAQAMLAENKLPLKIISHKLGFCTPSAFSVAFRKATGLTPKAYRARGSFDDLPSRPPGIRPS